MPNTSTRIPDRVRPFLALFVNTGGLDPDELLYRLDTEDGLAFSNAIVFSMALCVQSQVMLIETLLDSGLLTETPAG